MSEGTARLLHRLDLTEVERVEGQTEDHPPQRITWQGVAGANATNLAGRLFGGMVIAQTIVAGGRFDPSRHLHSLHQVFLRGGLIDEPIEYVTELLYGGRTYSALRVEVRQGGDLISHAQVGLSAGIPGPDRAAPRPTPGRFEDTIDRAEFRGRVDWQDAPIGVRVDLKREQSLAPDNEIWLKPNAPLPEDPIMHAAMLGYVSDRAFMRTAWKPHTDEWGAFQGSTLDHTIWFHRPVVFDDWHVFTMHSPVINDGRGLNHGAIHRDSDGAHVASVAQQGTFRPVST